MSITLTEAKKKFIAGKQYYKCANNPKVTLKGLEGYKCPLWQRNDLSIRGSFDESGYEIDHINEFSICFDDCEKNLQALCKNCHVVKTKKFLIRKKKSGKQVKTTEYQQVPNNEINTRSSNTLCWFGSNCNKSDCKFDHSITNVKLTMNNISCKFGANCNRSDCKFDHSIIDGDVDVFEREY